MITVHQINAFDDNYIWLLQKEGNDRLAVVDPGDAEPVLKWLEATGLELDAILITHHHHDHIGGISTLKRHFPVVVYGPQDRRINGITHICREGDVIELTNGLRFTVLETPGHTSSHISFVGHGTLFCGDTLFAAGCGRLFEGSPEQMYQSLTRLASLADETLVYCAHEYTHANLEFACVAEPDNSAIAMRQSKVCKQRQRGEATVPAPLAIEKKTNPFLRCHLPRLHAAAEQFIGHPLAQATDVFAAVRHWKDTLD